MELPKFHNRNLGRNPEPYRKHAGSEPGTHEEVPAVFFDDPGCKTLSINRGYDRWPDERKGHLTPMRMCSYCESDTVWNLRKDVGIVGEGDDDFPDRDRVKRPWNIVFSLPPIADTDQPEIEAFLPKMNCFVFEDDYARFSEALRNLLCTPPVVVVPKDRVNAGWGL